MNRQAALGALLVLLLVALFLLSLAIGRSSRAVDDGDRATLADLRSGLRTLPGLGSDLHPHHLDASLGCFNSSTSEFVAGPFADCRFQLPEGIDRVVLELVAGRCVLLVTDQSGVFDSRSDSAEWPHDRESFNLAGHGATVTITSASQADSGQRCVLRLSP